ncbi:MAG: cysteine-rich CWC family protein [Pyrinomonadaceae bacterium]|nr:cysteine-rich CWC family protein [Pyrinomonadaceae bacterium]
MLRNLSQYIQTSLQTAQTCEACGAEFNCGALGSSCWCAEVKLSEAVRAELRARYASCLCRACLESFVEVERGADQKGNG